MAVRDQSRPNQTEPVAQRRRWRRWGAVIGGALLAGYVAVCVAIYLLQDRLIYFPNRNMVLTPRDVKLDFEDLTLPTADGTSIHAWLIPHAEAKGTVIITYGNASNMSEQVGTGRTFHRLGFSVLLFDYPGYGQSEGAPSEAALYEAAEAVWNYVTETRAEPAGRVVLFGRSLGGSERAAPASARGC